MLPARHRLASRKTVSVADLADEAWIVPHADGPAGGYREMLERLCADAGFAPGIALETDDLQAAQAFVAAGLGDRPHERPHHADPAAEHRGSPDQEVPRLARPVAAVTAAGRHSPPALAMLEVLAGPGAV